MNKSPSFLLFVLLPSLFLSSCNLNDGISRLTEAIQVLFTGTPTTLKTKSPQPKAGLFAITAQRAKQNAEVLHEMYRDIYVQDPANAREFASLVDSLNQGASLEGVYNGLIHSSDYRELEKSHPGSNGKALQFFCEELVRTELQLSSVTVFSPDAAKPLSVPVEPTGTEGEIDFPNTEALASPAVVNPAPTSSPSKEQVDKLFHQYAHDFAGASYFTLKRVLGDELLELMSQKSRDKTDPKALAKWYGKFVHRMVSSGVDFGLALRNNPDESFHEGWAESVSGDQLRWEVLNRIHRVINSVENTK
jgi:hypothetical protein